MAVEHELYFSTSRYLEKCYGYERKKVSLAHANFKFNV